jgi:hypothetical protein
MAAEARAPVGAQLLEERIVEVERAIDVDCSHLARRIVENQRATVDFLGSCRAARAG